MDASPPSPPPLLVRSRPAARFAQVFLVLLRLAIGWHLFVQGYEKVRSVELGPTETNKPWTSRGFLLEAQGPFAPWFRKLAGDPDFFAQDYLRLPPSRDPRVEALTMPLKVEAAWDAHFKRFVEHHRPGKAQHRFLDELRKAHVAGFLRRPRPLERTFPAGIIAAPLSLSEQIDLYQQKRGELRQALEEELPAFGADVRKRALQDQKAEVARMQAAILRNIADATAAYEMALKAAIEALRPDTIAAGFVATLAQPQGQVGPVAALLGQAGAAGGTRERTALEGPALAAEIPLAPVPNPWLPWADFVMRWGLLLSGLLLLVGLFTPAACGAGAALLLLIFAAMPPLPGLPEPALKAPGQTLFVNQTLIEALALLALAAFPTGSWLGLDALKKLLPRRKPAPPPAPPAPPPKATSAGKHKRYTGA